MKKAMSVFLMCVIVALSMVGCGPKPSGQDESTKSSSADAIESSDSVTETSSEETSDTATSGPSSDSSPVSSSKTSKPNTSTNQSAGKVSVTVDKKLTPLRAGADMEALLQNPDRGFRWELWFNIQEMTEESTFEAMVGYARRQIKSSLANKDLPIKLIQSYMYIQAWKSQDISAKGLQAIEAVLKAMEELGYKALVRFVYIDDMHKWSDIVELKWMLRHIEQVTPSLKKYVKNIHTIEAGFIGAYAEWELTFVDPPTDEVTKLKYRTDVMNKLVSTMMPALDGIYLQARLPYYKNLVSKTNPYYNKIGIHNDAFFGKNSEKTGGDPQELERQLRAGSPGYQQVVKDAYLTPQGGELFWSESANASTVYADGLESILMMSEHRYTSFSGLHGNYEWGDRSQTTMGMWKKTGVTENWLKQAKVIGCPSFFKKTDGSTQKRNAYEFIQYHLGYYIELQSVKTSGDSKPGATVQVSVPLCNYGFSAAFNMRSGFAILDENNKVVSTVAAGDPEKWYSRDPDYSKFGQLTHTVSASLKLPTKSGKYKLAFYLKNDRGDFARVANDIETVNGYQILHTFDV